MPYSFLPNEDQGYVVANVQLPPGATPGTDLDVMQESKFNMDQPEVANMVSVLGFSFSGVGQNMALAFTPFKAWDERKGTAQDRRRGSPDRIIGAMMGT